MWVRSAAIRPVPGFARIERAALESAEEWIGGDATAAEARLSELFEQIERDQPVLAARLGGAFNRSKDEVATALGYFLSLTLYRAFDQAFRGRLQPISAVALRSVEEALALDEQLRGDDPAEPIDSDDVIAMEQPEALSFVHQHVESAIEVYPGRADVDAIHAMYRVLLIEVLALSYAVSPPKGTAANVEMTA